MRNGGRILVDQLELNGAELAFCVPGESYLPVLDALYDSPIRLITCRHEQGAANAAEAYGKLTGRPGLCLVTRGPGATQAAVGVHTAKQDSSPMILLVGQVPRAFRGREAWQELDYAQVFGGIAKAAWEVDSAERIPEHIAEAYLARALGEARAGRARAARGRARRGGRRRRRALASRRRAVAPSGRTSSSGFASCSPAPSARSSSSARAAGRPRRAATCRRSARRTRFRSRARFAARTSSTTARRATSACSVSRWTRRSPRAFATPTSCSRSAVGSARCRRAATPSSNRRDPRQTLVHVHPDAGELGRVYEPDLAIVATLTEFASALRALDPVEPRWREWTSAARADYEENLRNEPMEGDVDLGEIMAFLRTRLPGDAVQTCGAGNFTVWAHRFAEFTQFGTQACPRSGSMGYGLPAAVAAQLIHPERVVVCFTGDGDFVMSSPELATAVQYDLPIVVLLVNNGMYATIRMHQERQFPGRVIGTDLENPDFPALARAYGAHGERVERTEDFEAAFERALASGKPVGARAAGRSRADQPARAAERAAGTRMSREEIRVDGLAEPISHFTDAVLAGGFLYVSGIVAVDRRRPARRRRRRRRADAPGLREHAGGARQRAAVASRTS